MFPTGPGIKDCVSPEQRSLGYACYFTKPGSGFES